VAFFHEVDGHLDNGGVFVGEVGGFAEVGVEVVEFDFAGEHGLANGFPFIEANGLFAAAFVEFPVDEFGELLAVAAFASEGGDEADGLGVLWGFDAG